jgi:hypothetical protein
LDLNFRKKLVTATFGAELCMVLKLWTLWKVDQKYLESFEMWGCRRMEKISWTNCVRKEVPQRVKEDRNILQTIKTRTANLIDHMMHRKCLLKHVNEGKIKGRIEVTGR